MKFIFDTEINLKDKTCIIARDGNLLYSDKELGLNYNGINQVERTKESLENLYNKLKEYQYIPLIDGHKDIDGDDINLLKENGYLDNFKLFEKDGYNVIGADVVFGEKTREAYDSGKKQLSIGGIVNYKVKDDKIYQNIIDIEHVALVKSGRSGRIASIQDSLDRDMMYQNIKEYFLNKKKENKMNDEKDIQKENNTMLKSIFNMFSKKVEDEDKNKEKDKIEKLEDENKKLKDEIAEMKSKTNKKANDEALYLKEVFNLMKNKVINDNNIEDISNIKDIKLNYLKKEGIETKAIEVNDEALNAFFDSFLKNKESFNNANSWNGIKKMTSIEDSIEKTEIKDII